MRETASSGVIAHPLVRGGVTFTQDCRSGDSALPQASISRGVEMDRLICNAHLAMAAPRVPLAVHLDPLHPEERALWDRYAELVAAAGPSEMIVNKSRIAFKAPHRNFTGCFFKSRRLELFFDLPEPVPESERDSRFRAVWAHSRTIWVHRLKIERLDELDEKLGRWLAAGWEAYLKPAAER